MNPNPSENSSLTPDIDLADSDRRNAAWDIKNAPKNYLSLMLTQGATSLFSFASVWLITQTLGSEGYGEIVALVAASYVIQILVSWSTFALPRFGVEEFVQTGKISKTFWTRTFIFFPNLLLILVGAAFFLKPLGGLLKIPESSVWLVLAHFLTTAIWMHIQYALQGVKFLKFQGVLLAIERGLTFASILLLISIEHESSESVILCYILPPIFVSIIGIVVLNKFIERKNFFNWEWSRKMLIYSLPLVPFTLVGYLSTSQLDAIFITQFLSKADLGIYSVATQINGIVLQIPILANSLLLSLFVSMYSAGNKESIVNYITKLLPTITLLWGMICIVFALGGSLLVPYVFGAEFTRLEIPLLILLLGSASAAPSLFGFAAISHAYSATYISTVASVVMAVTNIGLNILLIPRYGLTGCAVATCISFLSSCLIIVVLSKRHVRFSLRELSISFIPFCVGLTGTILFGKIYFVVLIYFAGLVISLVILRSSVSEFWRHVWGNYLGRQTTIN